MLLKRRVRNEKIKDIRIRSVIAKMMIPAPASVILERWGIVNKAVLTPTATGTGTLSLRS